MRILDLDKFIKLKDNATIVDVRTPMEYQQGHIQKACNIPLLNNNDRIAVGKDYKQNGKTEAVKTGFRLVGSKISDIITEVEKRGQNKNLLVYCWRGGIRSHSFCRFMEMAGIKTYRLQGGYKRYRAAAFDFFKSPFQLAVLAGYTGSGKSDILRELDRQGEQVVDLEKLANHKGSVFGGLDMPPQPTTEQFQNLLFERLLTFDLSRRIWLEDESIAIGKAFIPNDFWTTMRNSPIILCQLDKPTRIARLVREYGAIDIASFYASMTKIAKKLGGLNFKKATQQLYQQNMPGVIDVLLTYYDKTYSYNLEKRSPEKWYTLYWDGKKISNAACELIQFMKLKSNIPHSL